MNFAHVTGTSVCMYWNLLHEFDPSTTALYQLNRATNWTEFTSALSLYHSASINVVYADIKGNIGYQMTGRFRIRSANHDGRYPVPGNGDYDYLGWIAFDDLPRVLNPVEGFIVTANNKGPPANYPFIITKDWEVPARAERIRQMLLNISSCGLYTLEDMKTVQLDVHANLFNRYKSILERIQPSDDISSYWRDRLLRWDAVASIGSEETSVFEVWVEQLSLMAQHGYHPSNYEFILSVFNSSNPTDIGCGMTS